MSTCFPTPPFPGTSRDSASTKAAREFASLAGVDDPSRAILSGESAAAAHLRSQVERIAPYFRTVLVRGQRGSGKRLIAEALHRLGPGTESPFITCNATSLAEGVDSTRAEALLDSARGGTLYVEEICSLSSTLQVNLLRLLETRDAGRPQRTERRPGYAGAIRLIASTERDPRTLVTLAQFRSDLYARLSAIEIVAPPLDQRPEDLPLFAALILERHATRTGVSQPRISAGAIAELARRHWPGNLRDLQDVLTLAAERAASPVLEAEDLPGAIENSAHRNSNSSQAEQPKPDRLDDVIQQHVMNVLARCGGNKLRAAELLGISRSTLYRMLETGAAASTRLNGPA